MHRIPRALFSAIPFITAVVLISSANSLFAQQTATGVVFIDRNDNGIWENSEDTLRGIRVSNGREIVKTDAAGRYQLPVDDDTTIFVIKPRNFRTPVDDMQLPQFYYTHKPQGSPASAFAGVAPTGELPAAINFPLYPQDEPDQFKALLFGDPQPRNLQEVEYVAHDVVEELLGTDASFGVTLGDIAFDNLRVLEPQARFIALLGIPWYNVIGNHDLNLDAQHDRQSDETFERIFGPNYYSFDHGPVHFLVLDDVAWYVEPDTGKGTYRGGLDEDQLEFIRRDLELIPKDQLVVLMMHIPLTDVSNRSQLYRLIEKRPFCMSISAHTHMLEHRFITREDGWQGPEPHHHLINVTVCGSWWTGAPNERGIPHTTMADGAPNGYTTITFDGHKYDVTFKAAGHPKGYQMAVHMPEEVSRTSADTAEVWVNVFNGSERSTVEMRIGDSGKWQPLDRTLTTDPWLQAIFDAEAKVVDKLQAETGNLTKPWRKLTAPKTSTHLWRGTLQLGLRTGTHSLQVRTKDMHGKVYCDERLFRVAP